MELNKDLNEDELSNIVLGAAIDVHTQLGPGLLENVYKKVLAIKLQNLGLRVELEKTMPIVIDGVTIDLGYKIDLLIQDKLVIELKSVKEISDVHLAQTINYLRLGGYKLGLIINFNVSKLKYGIKRVINTKGPRPF
jgi:GxxExxY protein